ncbi:transposase [Limnoglobus roseus]|uniref:transposase n=1 Tax=Limnoglobus roseus TaxID=2598579 RepID=UPI0036F36B5D
MVLVIDNAPWHRGQAIDAALADHPHLAFYRLPSYSPSLNPVEQFWKKLRRRATHNRLFDTPADLKRRSATACATSRQCGNASDRWSPTAIRLEMRQTHRTCE